MNDPDFWLNQSQEEIEAKWAASYQAGAVKEILKQIGRQDLLSKWRALDVGTDVQVTFAMLVEELGFPVWLVPRKVKQLGNLTVELVARPTRTALFQTYKEVCEEIPENIGGCPARGIVFNWPRHGLHSVLHDLQDQPLGGHGWFFHRKKDNKRLTLQPLKSLIEGLGDPNDWAN